MCIVSSAISADPIRASTPMATFLSVLTAFIMPLPTPLCQRYCGKPIALFSHTYHLVTSRHSKLLRKIDLFETQNHILSVQHRRCLEASAVKAVDALHSKFRAVDNLDACNTTRVLKAFQNARVGSHHLGGCTGYGHDEGGGRGALDQAFAEIVGPDCNVLICQQFFSGTHAITCALFALLRPRDEPLAVAGAPYDTLQEVIGKRDSGGLGSLQDFGVKYREVPLPEDGGLDWNALMSAIKPKTKCALIQRSCGYSWRQSLSLQDPSCSVMVDNCYGKFVESIEPSMVGADLIAGSLIKNPSETIAPCGGYRDLVWIVVQPPVISCEPFSRDYFFPLKWLEKQSSHAPASSFSYGSGFLTESSLFSFSMKYVVCITSKNVLLAVQLGSRERLLAFCGAVQRNSLVGSYTKPVAGTTPGNASEVIFADGTFIDGSTSELSCDGPLRGSFAVFCQGGTHGTQWGLVLGEVLKSL
ncbi:YnbB protein [Spatholobus suberectus]|nr:YnbB protein [Spatholobus suberectus]